MADKKKIPGKKYVGYCEHCGWLTKEDVRVEITLADKKEKESKTPTGQKQFCPKLGV